MIDDQRPCNEPDTPTPPTEHPTNINSQATAQLNRTPEWTLRRAAEGPVWESESDLR